MNARRIVGMIIIIVLLISGVVLVALYKVGDRVFNEMIEQAMFPDDISDVPDAITEAAPTAEPEKQNTDTVMIPPSDSAATGTAGRQKQEPVQTPAAPEPTVPAATAPAVMPAIDQSAAEPSKPTAESTGDTVNAINNVQIPKQKIEEIKEDVTASDKMAVAALVFKKLKQHDIAELVKMAAGGITGEEKEKMKKLAFERFTPEEIEKIKGMYYKYIY